ncbi:uncharacterized protein LOC106142331 [Amyelois transitella]|uniref:uncharacterized protein LOC106142331 n=1 Tax=Amyelois transitella TaxID=680683 RepID=UPI00298F4258|nr:uncharacterized protein LOC106142331 [Amyelois transitella]
MDGNTCSKLKKLEDILTEKQIDCILRKFLGRGKEWRVVRSDVKAAADGLSGFLGDHLRVTLEVCGDSTETVQLFVKRLPYDNQPKVDFIAENNFFKREALVGQLLDELQSNSAHPWCVKTLIATDTIIVMPDMRPLGYSVRSHHEYLDVPHLLRTAASVARFHAATTNYETKRSSDRPWTFSKEYAEILIDPAFKDSPWMRACAKVTANVLKIFSKKYGATSDLEAKITQLFLQACASLREYEGTLNVLLHKDLWIANIMFRYENGDPANALLIDYQCLRYGPPAFDLMILLYCTTSRSFREQNELKILQHYFSVFLESLEDATKVKLDKLVYKEKEFLQWCERARMFGAMQAAALFPYILMDPVTAQQTYDDPETFDQVMWADRTEPVLEYCRQNPGFQQRLMEVLEEFAERYLGK